MAELPDENRAAASAPHGSDGDGTRDGGCEGLTSSPSPSSLSSRQGSTSTESSGEELAFANRQLRLTVTESEGGEDGRDSPSGSVEAILGGGDEDETRAVVGEGAETNIMAAGVVVSPLTLTRKAGGGDDVGRPATDDADGKTGGAGAASPPKPPLDGFVSDDSLDLGDAVEGDLAGSARPAAATTGRPCGGPPRSRGGSGGDASAPQDASPSEEDGATSLAATSTSDLSTSAEDRPDTPPSRDGSQSSSLLDVLLGEVSNGILEAEEEGHGESSTSSAAPSDGDAGGSQCTSTTPVINLAASASQEGELATLGAFAKAAAAATEGGPAPAEDAAPSESKDEPALASDGADGTVVETSTSSGSRSVDAGGGDRSDASRSPRKAVHPIPLSPNSSSSYGAGPGSGGYDKKRLSERLRQRLAKRNAMHLEAGGRAAGSPGASPRAETDAGGPGSRSDAGGDRLRDRSLWETRLQAASRLKRRSKSRAKSEGALNADGPNSDIDGPNSDILSKYSSENKIYPDTVTFSDGEDEDEDEHDNSGRSPGGSLRVNTRPPPSRHAYRKCVSEVGVSLSLSTRAVRSKLGKHHHSHHHGIGILQADGIVYNDALLLRLARQARYGRLRGEVSHKESTVVEEKRYNNVKIHVYDLLTKDALVEMPYFNCNFPIGQCFKVVNDGCHVLGTGAYHVGVEVNGVEYAFGANNIIGMSGIFTCVPKESPGYEYRESLDFGKLHTTKRTWIRIPKSGTGVSFKTISAALGGSSDNDDRLDMDPNVSTRSLPVAGRDMKNVKNLYSFKEIESFADGHAIIHSMAREYMGTDYDLLRKNCCTFARDVCIRMGVKEESIPKWFHNAAQAGADAEDAITSVEYSVRNMLDCSEWVDPLDVECYNHGFEVIVPNLEKGAGSKLTAGLKVVESPSMRMSRDRKPLSDSEDCLSDMHETASWTY